MGGFKNRLIIADKEYRTVAQTFERLLSLLGALLWLALGTSAWAAPDRSPWEHSLITIEVTHNVYDFLQPWSLHTEEHRKNGVVVGPGQVLTTADHMASRTLVRAQKGGRGRWYNAEVQWIDYHANLALLTVSDANFWQGLSPVMLVEPAPTKGSIEVMRWRDGVLESRKGDVNRVTIKRGKLTFIDHLQMELTCEIKDAGWSEVVAMGKRLVGLVVYHDENVLTVIPAPFISHIIEGHRHDPAKGLGFFAFLWQRAQNPAVHHAFKQTAEQGVVVVDAVPYGGNEGVLQPHDVLLQVDGFDIDSEGDYVDPDYGKLLLENLATRRHWAGDEVRMRIWRDGAATEVKYRLPKVEYTVELVPQAVYDRPPEYLIVGGLVFQPLTEPYLRSWGADWLRRVPFRLGYYEQEKPTTNRTEVVLLSMVLPDPYNVGYQDFRYLPVHTINGKTITHFQDVQAAFKQPRDGFHIIEFDQGDWLQEIVLDSNQAEGATRRVLQRYNIERASTAPLSVH
jgi:hypothetical protein